jgi:ATP-dependent 26S proteasome regulatory subunit
MNTERYDFDSFLDGLEEDFYENGPLKGAFFDLKYNFIERDANIDDLLAWDPAVKQTLWNDIITFQKAMPKLKELGLANSRGVILAGPPGTGKTMIAKWLAANSNITCILISAEMITGRQDIKKCYELARRVSPTLLIIEDIDTAGALDRRASDHPLLGEFLQSMDGVVPNHGVITLATTNHSNKIDPAIADRPGRFDRIVEVGLPDKEQRFHILHQHLKSMDAAPTVNREAIERLAKTSDGLTGAWLREVIQSALIASISADRDLITKEDLTASLKDILKRRGMAYRITPYGAKGQESANAYVQ